MKKYKKRVRSIISIVLASAMVFAFAALIASPIQHFKDVPTSHWAYQQIERAYADGVIAGVSGNPEQGTGVFEPAGMLTMAQFMTIMTRGFYGDELQKEIDKGSSSPWYAAAQNVANRHGLLNGTKGGMTANVTRYDMAAFMTNILKDKDAVMPTAAEKTATQAKIGDFSKIPSGYKDAVTTVFFFGVISGTDQKGTFSGNNYMNRAQAAVVYGRLKDVMDNFGGEQPPVEPEEPEKPVEPEQPVEPEKPVGPSNVVGTISSTPVTLSLGTHKPIKDYWSEQSAEVRTLSDKDAFNAAVDTLVHSELINSNGMFNGRVNKYYNYAVYAWTKEANQIAVNKAVTFNAYGVQFGTKAGTGFAFFTAYPFNEAITNEFTHIFSKFTSNMSDREKVEICINAVCDRFDYEINGGFTWTNGKSTGDCDDFSVAINQILGAAGIPCYQIKGDVRDGAHAWNHAYVDGEWVVIDGGAADVGYGTTMTMSEHERLYGYPHSMNTGNITLVRQALIETAERYR